MKNKKPKNDGISLSSHTGHEMDMALISLKIGFEAYYSTYQLTQGHFARFVEIPSKNFSFLRSEDAKSSMDWSHVSNLNYTKAYIQIIFHFQHFIEVSIKEILRQEHPLLAVLTGRQHVILHKLLMKEDVAENESEGLYTIDFREAIGRLKELIDEKRIINYEDMKFISEAARKNNVLEEIGLYRNRLVHRGNFMLPYTELDKFIGEEILPFILKMVNLPIYTDSEVLWLPKKLHCQIDPLQEIISECGKPDPNLYKVAFLKEMGRAAFINPLWAEGMNPWFSWTGEKEKERVEEQSVQLHENEYDVYGRGVYGIQICPVCGAKSLMQYYDNLSPDPEEESVEIYRTTCLCCSFSVDRELGNVEFKEFDVKKFWEMSQH